MWVITKPPRLLETAVEVAVAAACVAAAIKFQQLIAG
jgi:hypothetical protein